MKLEKFSIGTGDRFTRSTPAQLDAVIAAEKQGVMVIPVWNKSFREHSIIGSQPVQTQAAAQQAVKLKNWKHPYHLDADHINLNTVDGFVPYCDFFTLDAADYIGKPAAQQEVDAFINRNRKFIGNLKIEGISHPLHITGRDIELIACKFLYAVKQAGAIYRHICEKKNSDDFITEFSVDESDQPQSPLEMLFILEAAAYEKIPIQTIAPKFTGRFNKGIDYVGDVNKFEIQFNDNLAVINFAVKNFGLPSNLKISVHSGSDKFTLYPIINKGIKKLNAGLHLKTAGTTWLAELVGLAKSGSRGLAVAKKVYRGAVGRFDELCKPYATVIDIDKTRLPDVHVVDGWDERSFAEALDHNQSCPKYNLHFRQFLHVSFRIAAEMKDEYLSVVDSAGDIIGAEVTKNLFERHIMPVFAGKNL